MLRYVGIVASRVEGFVVEQQPIVTMNEPSTVYGHTPVVKNLLLIAPHDVYVPVAQLE